MAKDGQNRSTSFFGTGMTTTASITLVLLLLGLTILVGFMGKEIPDFIKENMGITIELADNMKEADVAKLQKELQESPYVKTVTFVSKEEIKEQLVLDLGMDPEEFLGFNPASDCLEVNLNAAYANSDSMQVVEQSLKGKNIVQNIIYNKDDLDIVNSNLSKIATTLIILAIILSFISFTLIRNTIRLNIYSKRFIINTMQLVGATDAFIRKPFVIQTVLCGIIAAIFANIFITGIIYYFTKEYTELLSIISIDDLLLIFVIVLVMGILLTFFATRSAVNKYLRMKTNNLYYI